MVKSYLVSFSGVSGGVPPRHAGGGVVEVTKKAVNTDRWCRAGAVVVNIVGVRRAVGVSVVGVAP